MSKKSSFVDDTILIESGLDFEINTVKKEQLKAAFLPYYIDPESLELKVVLKRSILPGQFTASGKKMGLTALTVDLPMNEQITIEQAFEKLNLNTKVVNPIPFGSVMPDVENSSIAYELVVVNVEPLNLIDSERGIFHQEKGVYEIGVAEFRDIVEGIKNGIIQDMKTRLLLNELYILAIEESRQNQDPNNMMTGNPDLIGGGLNLPAGYGSQSETVKTSNIPDEVIEQNSKMDFGSIYSKVTPTQGNFTNVN